ncbi:MAG: hypothetical protein U1E93_04205 [Alphaproteobacteria bacterium]
MPRFFFHVREGGTLNRDEEGQDLADAAAARREALSAGREILGEKLLHGGQLDNRIIEITGEDGKVVETVNVDDVLYKDGKFRTYADDVTQSAPQSNLVNTPRS